MWQSDLVKKKKLFDIKSLMLTFLGTDILEENDMLDESSIIDESSILDESSIMDSSENLTGLDDSRVGH